MLDILKSLWRLTKLVIFPSSEVSYDKLNDGSVPCNFIYISDAPSEQNYDRKNEGGVVAVSIIFCGLLMTLANTFIFTSTILLCENSLIQQVEPG